jgi:ribosomal small subunit protein bTHX
MGKGDKKSKKGKIWLGSYGVRRSRKAIKARLKRELAVKPVVAPVAVVEEKPKPKRAPRKKEAAE